MTRGGRAGERLVVIPWWGESAPEVTDVVSDGGKLRLIVELPHSGLPFGARAEVPGAATASASGSARRFHRRVASIPSGPEPVEVEYRAPGSWMMGHRLALRLSGYDPDALGHVVPASLVELDADWMLRRLSPVVELFDGAEGAGR